MLIYTLSYSGLMGNRAILSHFISMPILECVHPLYIDGCLTIYDFDWYTINPERMEEIARNLHYER